GAFSRTRTAAQRGLFRLLRPFWFQHRHLHSELISVLSQLTGEVASMAREIVDVRTVAASLRDDGTARRKEVTALAAQVASERAASTQLESEMGARIATLTRTATEAGALAERVGALEPAVAELRATSDSRFASVAAHLEGLTQVVGKTERSL